MPKTLCNFRIERTKLDELRRIAKEQRKKYSQIIREKIDEVLNQ